MLVLWGAWCWSIPATAETPRALLKDATSWAYQLQNVDIEELRSSTYDVIVLDVEDDTRKPWQPRVIESLRVRDDKPRVVLAYLSVGEAENYRAYWQPEWSRRRPAWLGRENPSWRGNFAVKYWMPEWHQMLFRFGGMLDKVIGAGFDGVYLDRLDIYMTWGPSGRGARHRKHSATAMVRLVERIAHHARVDRSLPEFLVVGQNAPLLCDHPKYVAAVDAVALEDLFYYRRRGRDGARRNQRYTRFILESLTPLRNAGRPVFTVDYIPSKHTRRRYESLTARHDVVPFAAPSRALNRLP